MNKTITNSTSNPAPLSFVYKNNPYAYYFSEPYSYYHAWFANKTKKEEELPVAFWWIYFGVGVFLLLIGAFCFYLSHHRKKITVFEYMGVIDEAHSNIQ